MADVFISYARASVVQAKQIAARLKSCGYTVWFDEGLPAHRAFSDVIEEQLNAAKAVLVLWSRDGARSEWVRSEANHAREQKKLVQARLDDVQLPMPFDQIHCAELGKRPGKSAATAWKCILESIGDLAGRNPANDPGQVGVDRRTLIIGAAAGAAVLAGGAAAWRMLGSHSSSPEARLLLAVGDTTRAAAALDRMLDRLRFSPPGALNLTVSMATLVRAMALRAEIAAARKESGAPVQWGRAVAALWSNADPELKPTVRRLLSLSPPR